MTPVAELTEATVPLDDWVGKQDRLLRRSVIDMAVPEAEFSLMIGLDLFDYGVEANITFPPSKDTFLVKDLEDFERIQASNN